MKGTNLGEFEELVLLTIAGLTGEAYSVAICDELTNITERKIRLGMMHSVLKRLEEKGMVESHLGEATKKRGGKRKRFYTVTTAGKAALETAQEVRQELWSRIPEIAWKNL